MPVPMVGVLGALVVRFSSHKERPVMDVAAGSEEVEGVDDAWVVEGRPGREKREGERRRKGGRGKG